MDTYYCIFQINVKHLTFFSDQKECLTPSHEPENRLICSNCHSSCSWGYYLVEFALVHHLPVSAWFLQQEDWCIIWRYDDHYFCKGWNTKVDERKFSGLGALFQFSSVHFSCSVVSDSLQPNESQHARPPCPSPSPGVHSDSRPSSP